VDVSGTDPLIPSIRHDVAGHGVPGHALAIRAGAKHTKYGMMAANQLQGKEFFPVVVETFGGLGRDALRLLDLVSLDRGIVPQFLSQDDKSTVS
jgi:hypothetical protein